MKTLLVMLALLGLSVAYAKSYHVTLYEKSILGSTELKPGQYTVELKDQQLEWAFLERHVAELPAQGTLIASVEAGGHHLDSNEGAVGLQNFVPDG